MQLRLLCTTSCLSIYHESRHNGLFLDWTGELTLYAVQEACVAVAQCYLTRTYSRVLNSNLHVTAVGGSVSTWLGAEFLPYLAVVGVEQVAWVSAPVLAGRNQAQTVVNRMPSLVINLFDNVEDAAAWLHQPRIAQPESYLLSPRQTTTQVRLAQSVQAIRQEVRLVQREVQHLQQKVGGRAA